MKERSLDSYLRQSEEELHKGCMEKEKPGEIRDNQVTLREESTRKECKTGRKESFMGNTNDIQTGMWLVVNPVAG